MYGYSIQPFAWVRGYCFRPFAVGCGQGVPCPYGVNPGVLWYLIPVHPRTTYGIRAWVAGVRLPTPHALPIVLNTILKIK